MSWLYFAYLAVYTLLLADGIRDDSRKGHSAWYIMAGVIGAASMVALVLSFWSTSLAELLGKAPAFLLTVGLVWDLVSGYTDLKSEQRPADITPLQFIWMKIGAAAVVLGYSLPAYWMAFTVARRALSTGPA